MMDIKGGNRFKKDNCCQPVSHNNAVDCCRGYDDCLTLSHQDRV